jgi:TatA/E family protein of Tat protein translocase
MFGLQPTHLIIILVIALLVFGPSRLPDLGKALGKTIIEFRDATKQVTAGLAEEPKSAGGSKQESKAE